MPSLQLVAKAVRPAGGEKRAQMRQASVWYSSQPLSMMSGTVRVRTCTEPSRSCQWLRAFAERHQSPRGSAISSAPADSLWPARNTTDRLAHFHLHSAAMPRRVRPYLSPDNAACPAERLARPAAAAAEELASVRCEGRGATRSTKATRPPNAVPTGCRPAARLARIHSVQMKAAGTRERQAPTPRNQ
jgi:hypothetical protein